MTWEGRNVLITGASGFVGSYLAEDLISKGASVFGLIRRKADGTRPKNLIDRGVADKIGYIEGDLTNQDSLAHALDASQPEYIFHLGAQSFIPRSFECSNETQQFNGLGTANLLDAVRIKDIDPKIVFAGSSEEYGLVISSQQQYERVKEKYDAIFPDPVEIPELPIKETNPLRPMSPYAVTKVYGDYLMRNYYHSYGLKTVVSRGFNHEGAGRGIMFVTSAVAAQVKRLQKGETDHILIGNVGAFRDWSHVKDIVVGYELLAEKGLSGDVYNQGSMRTNSVLSYILLCLQESGWDVRSLETLKNGKRIDDPVEFIETERYGLKFPATKADRMLLDEEVEFELEDEGLTVGTDKGDVRVKFNPKFFRPAEVPILMCDASKSQALGFEIKRKLTDIISDQLEYYENPANRNIQ